MLNDNGPTHVDSFSHLDPDPEAQTIDRMDLGLFFGPAVCLDVSMHSPRTDITAAHLDEALESSGQSIEPGDHCFFYTATFDRYHDQPQYLTDFLDWVSRPVNGSSTKAYARSGSTRRRRTILLRPSTPCT